VRFWDREKEVKDLKAHIESEPNSILFVYGPKSSGKSTLLQKVIDDLMEDDSFKGTHQVYWFDLRGKLISNYRDVVDLFFIDEDSYKKIEEKSKKLEAGFMQFFKVELETRELMESKRLDPFVYMEEVLKGQEKIGVIVFDELQKLKDVYINGERKFVSELFNFFVRLTKVLHLSHVIVMTSDTFFIEEVYTSSSLKNTSIYYLVDYFDDETAREILIEEGLSKEDADYIVDMSGGVPWIMAEVTSNGDPKEKLMAIYDQVKSRLLGYIENKMINGEDEKITYRVLEKVLKGLYPKTPEELREVRKLVQAEVLFYEPIKRKIKFQTKLDERAAEKLLISEE